MDIISIKMYRNLSQTDMFDEDRVLGKLKISYRNKGEFRIWTAPVLENRDYVFQDGLYHIKFENSPKFGRKLWEFKDIFGRSEIKFHSGRYIKHTLGCPILKSKDLETLHNILDPNKDYFIVVETN